MNREGHENVNFFFGSEVEHTPVHGHKTMFIVGVQPQEKISWELGEYNSRQREPVTHLYFGANHSFKNIDTNDADGWRPWEDMIRFYLDKGYWCTLDIDVACVEGLLESGLCEYSNFVPMISVKLPYLQQLGYNATIKLDDKDFDATNPGVWCHSLHNLLNRDQFTSWSKYTKDEVKR